MLDGIGAIYYNKEVKCNLGIYDCGTLKTGVSVQSSYFGYTINLMFIDKDEKTTTLSYFLDQKEIGDKYLPVIIPYLFSCKEIDG